MRTLTASWVVTVAGAPLGDGRVALIVDVPGLLRDALRLAPACA